jgi:hypothetical protein
MAKPFYSNSTYNLSSHVRLTHKYYFLFVLVPVLIFSTVLTVGNYDKTLNRILVFVTVSHLVQNLAGVQADTHKHADTEKFSFVASCLFLRNPGWKVHVHVYAGFTIFTDNEGPWGE